MKLTEDEQKFGWQLKQCVKCGRTFKNHPDYDTNVCGQAPKAKIVLRRKVEQFYSRLNDVSVERASAVLKHDKKMYLRYVAIYMRSK